MCDEPDQEFRQLSGNPRLRPLPCPALPRAALALCAACEVCNANQHGWVAEWSIAAVLKTVEARASGGSNPSPSAMYFSHYIVLS
jgi:hypothetical protein